MFMNIVRETHIEHFIGLIEHQVINFIEIDVAKLHVRHESARRGNDDIGAGFERFALLVPVVAFAPAINGDAVGLHKIAEAFYLLVNLLGQLTRGHQNQRAGMIVVSVRNAVEERNKVGGCFAGAGLGTGDKVASFENFGDGQLLNGGGF